MTAHTEVTSHSEPESLVGSGPTTRVKKLYFRHAPIKPRKSECKQHVAGERSKTPFDTHCLHPRIGTIRARTSFLFIDPASSVIPLGRQRPPDSVSQGHRVCFSTGFR